MRNKLIWAFIIAIFLFLTGISVWRRGDALPSRIRIATGGTAGVYHSYGAALAGVIKDNMGVPADALTSGGAIENIRLLRDGKAELAFVQNDIMTYAYDGTNIFSTEEAFKGFYAIAGLYPEVCQIVARKDISGIQDLKGKSVSLGDRGGGTELNALQILASYGLSEADVEADYLGFSASVEAFREGRLDAFFCTAGVPTPAITDLAKSGEIHLLSVGEAHARALISEYPFYTRQAVGAGVYPGMDEGAETVAVQATLAVSGKLGEDAVFEITRVLFENKDKIAEACEEGGSLNRETATNGILIPLHPGAEKYLLR
ncbi:C4-dicarboxylate ABC transporter substrate-binding protein [Synergistales bacterium]|nr:C4-dicarboxylate ABC transporter substrate-binding protein [Synergistales bacterium]